MLVIRDDLRDLQTHSKDRRVKEWQTVWFIKHTSNTERTSVSTDQAKEKTKKRSKERKVSVATG